MKTAIVALAGLLLCTAAEGGTVSTWRGHYTLAGVVPMSLELTGGAATVVLPAGYPAPSRVSVARGGGRIRFSLPGRPSPLLFDGRAGATTITGTVRQGAAHGTFTLRPGPALDGGLLGAYRLANGDRVSVTRPGSPTTLLVDYDTARIHGLFRRNAANWDVGSGLGVRAPVAGQLKAGANSISIDGVLGPRIAARELQVRFRSGNATLAGTLSVPATPGKHPAVAMVHGSGFTTRVDAAVMASYFVTRGLAVLTYDKRGTGLSGGSYPGEAPTKYSVNTYARDAEAAVRFLAAQPEVDTARVGLAGSSQAGWIMPFAASHSAAVRFVVAFSGPTVTTGEQKTYQDMTTEGAQTPTQSPSEILAAVRRAGPSGFDPLPAIRTLRIPVLWVYGAIDQHVPAKLCLERLAPLLADGTHEFQATELASADHFLLLTEHALQSEQLRTSRYAEKAFSTVDAWLAARQISR